MGKHKSSGTLKLAVNESIVTLLLKIYKNHEIDHGMSKEDILFMANSVDGNPFDYVNQEIKLFGFENKNEIDRFGIGNRVFKILIGFVVLYEKRELEFEMGPSSREGSVRSTVTRMILKGVVKRNRGGGDTGLDTGCFS